jgi:hypothetical protein
MRLACKTTPVEVSANRSMSAHALRRIHRYRRCRNPFAADAVLFMVQIRPPLSPRRFAATAAVHERCTTPEERAIAAGHCMTDASAAAVR